MAELGRIAGIAGISIGALVLIFGSVIRKNIFPGLTKEQAYKVIRMILVFAGVLAFAGLGAWVYLDVAKNARAREGKLATRYIIGNVVDGNGNPVVSANIEVSQDNSFLDKTDGKGKFALEIKGMGQKYIDLMVKHKSFVTNREKVKVDFDDGETDIKLEHVIVLENAFPPEQQEPQGRPESRTSDQQNNTAVSQKANITLKYMGDALDCSLNLAIDLGDQAINPTSNFFSVSGVATGIQEYDIYGTISCGYESCDATGEGTLNIRNGGVYYVMWNYDNCIVGLYSEQDYTRLNGL